MKVFGFRMGEPVTARSLAVAGDAARDRRAWKAAARHYRASLALNPDRTDLWVQLGHALKESGDRAGAGEAYAQALARAPENADIYLQLGHLFKLQARWTEAAAAYETAARLDPALEDPARELRWLIMEGLASDTSETAEPAPEPPAALFEESDEPADQEVAISTPPLPAPEPQRYFYLAEGLGLTRLLDGHFLYVDPLDETVASHLIARGYWEDWIHRTVCALVRPGDRIVEVGANFGVYTVAMARLAGPTGSVLTFEANPRLAGLVQRSVRFNGYAPSTEVIAKAAADKPGQISFAISRRNAGGGTISSKDKALSEDGELIHVETVTLDSVAPDGVRFLRMDAEGSEPLILRGAERLLANPEIVVCMEWDVVQMAARADVRDFVQWLRGMGFRFWRIQYDATLLEIPADQMHALPACDVVMSRAEPEGPPIATAPL